MTQPLVEYGLRMSWVTAELGNRGGGADSDQVEEMVPPLWLLGRLEECILSDNWGVPASTLCPLAFILSTFITLYDLEIVIN